MYVGLEKPTTEDCNGNYTSPFTRVER